MDSLPVKIPKNAVEDLARLFIPQNTPEDSYLELIIKIKTDNLTFRELGYYLVLIDKYYGYLYPEGIYAYSHKEEEHLRISEIKNGCIEVIIRKVISSVIPGNLVILFLLLKYLPNIVKSSSEAVKNFAEAYKLYEEASILREERRNRKNLREALKEDEHLKNLDNNRIEQIVKLLDTLYAKDTKKLARAIKTSKHKISSVTLKINNKKK